MSGLTTLISISLAALINEITLSVLSISDDKADARNSDGWYVFNNAV